MQKNTLFILLLSVVVHFSNAQSSVAIGSNTPNPKAVLWLNAQGAQGLLLPSISSSSRTGMALNNSTEKGMLVYDNQLDKIFYWNGLAWIEAVGGSGGSEVDGIIGNEVTKVTADRGLSLSGSGTAASPLSVGLIDGTADQQVLKWNNTTKRWELGTDAGTSFTAGTGIQITGTTLTNTGDTDATNDLTTTSLAAGDISGLFSNLQIGAGTVSSTELSTDAVTTVKIADDAVTIAKIGTAGATDALKVLSTDASGNPQWSPLVASGNMLSTVYDPTAINANAFDLNNHIGDIATTQVENGAITPIKIAGAGASTRGILSSDNNTVAWVSGAPDQLLGTDASGAFQFTAKSNYLFTSNNVIPKGSASGLTSSQLFDDGTNVGIGNAAPAYKLDVFGTALIRPVIIGSAPYQGTSWFSMQHQQLPLNNISYAFAQHKGGYTLINTPSNAGSNFIDFRVDDVSKLRISEAGYVGVGTTSPTTALHVNSASSPALRVVDGTQGANKMMISDLNGNASWAGAPGLDFVESGGGDIVSTNSASTNINSVAVTVPGPGYVLVTASGSVYLSNSSTAGFLARIKVSNTIDDTNETPGIQFLRANGFASTGSANVFPFSTSKVFQVASAGTYTFYLNMWHQIVNGTLQTDDYTLIANFVPNRY